MNVESPVQNRDWATGSLLCCKCGWFRLPNHLEFCNVLSPLTTWKKATAASTCYLWNWHQHSLVSPCFAWMTLNMTTARHPTSMTTRIIPGEKRSPFASQSKAPVTMKHRINLNVTQLDNRNYGTTWERIYSAWSCLEYQTIKLARIECLHHRLP